MTEQGVERICEEKDPTGRLCLQPPGHKHDHRNGEHTWPNEHVPHDEGDTRTDEELANDLDVISPDVLTRDEAVRRLRGKPVMADSPVRTEPWVTVGFVKESGDPEDSYRISVTRQGVTHYMGAVIEGWELAKAEARALADVLGPVARVGPIWGDNQCEEGSRIEQIRGLVAEEITARSVSEEDVSPANHMLAFCIEELGIDPARCEEGEPEAECEWCTDLHDYFELAEEPSQVAHPHMADHPGGFCLVCRNFKAHPWHEDAPSLSGLQEIGRYLTTMGFRIVRESAEDLEPVALVEVDSKGTATAYPQAGAVRLPEGQHLAYTSPPVQREEGGCTCDYHEGDFEHHIPPHRLESADCPIHADTSPPDGREPEAMKLVREIAGFETPVPGHPEMVIRSVVNEARRIVGDERDE